MTKKKKSKKKDESTRLSEKEKELFEENLKQLKEISNLHKEKMRKLTYMIIIGNFFILFAFLVILWAFGFFG